MNILIVTTRLPYPMISGAKIRAFHILKALAERHKVTLISFYGTEAEEKHFNVYTSLGVKFIPILNPAIDRQVGLKALFHSLSSGLPLTVSKYTHSAMSEAIAENVRTADVIHCEHMHMAEYLPSTTSPRYWMRTTWKHRSLTATAVVKAICSRN